MIEAFFISPFGFWVGGKLMEYQTSKYSMQKTFNETMKTIKPEIRKKPILQKSG